VAEEVRVEARQAGLLTDALDGLFDASVREAAALAEPQPGQLGVGVMGAGTLQIAIEDLGGLLAVRAGACGCRPLPNTTTVSLSRSRSSSRMPAPSARRIPVSYKSHRSAVSRGGVLKPLDR
jgi:hypothetical protein